MPDEMKWTPGPWEARTFLVMAGRDRITHVGGNLPPNRSHESEANARLIAAAPDLYTALQDLHDAVKGGGYPHAAMAAASAALARPHPHPRSLK